MDVLTTLKDSIKKVGIKEVARRAQVSASTVSRINSGDINPSLEVSQKISKALGLRLEVVHNNTLFKPPRLAQAKDRLVLLRKQLKTLGVVHAVIFGSVAKKTDKKTSDIDLYLDFGEKRPSVKKMLKAEGLILKTLGENKVDIISDLSTPKAKKLKNQIDKDGVYVF